MRKLAFLTFIIAIFGLLFAGCGQEKEPQVLSCGDYLEGETWQEDCNTCFCENGETVCTEIACPEKNDSKIQDRLNEIEFNSNLTNIENRYLAMLQEQYVHSKIYHIKTKEVNCDECYDLSYKKDREIIKLEIRYNKLKTQKIVKDNLATEIENENVCRLFGGSWNECPSPCETDEEACITMCNPPVCEFDYNKIIYNKLGEVCGGIGYGDCEYGLKCYFEVQSDETGICKED
ncbi:MAG: hypothetical protein ACOCXG_00365 [Nanoarchaeota archaeon]